ncbi:hypothetical protein L9F63_001108, partial [Diploptera punctata]
SRGNRKRLQTSLWVSVRDSEFQVTIVLNMKILKIFVFIQEAFLTIKRSKKCLSLRTQGGRLERELRYTQAALGEADSSTHQLMIQTPRDSEASLLHPAALLAHLEVLKAATSVTVQLFDIRWRLPDMCYSPSIPNFDVPYIDQ